jgi:hypothetical protein
MATRVHLGSVEKLDGTVWFTLVIDNLSTFYVEQYNDSRQPLIRERIKTINPAEFNHYEVNGTPLSTLVETKMKEIFEAAKVVPRPPEPFAAAS